MKILFQCVNIVEGLVKEATALEFALREASGLIRPYKPLIGSSVKL